jgi:hypothetical protein
MVIQEKDEENIPSTPLIEEKEQESVPSTPSFHA